MKPNFALSLSFDGIQLLRRIDGGWQVLGNVAVDDPEMPAKLAALRERAKVDADGALRTKLIIPHEQIKFTAIDTAMTTNDDVLAAMEGATPYSVSDLVIDSERGGGRTHIAAVAKDTLDEAEAFAVEHKFNPVAFVAIPDPLTFTNEVFFGETAIASTLLVSGERVEPDEPVKVTGEAPVPEAPELVETESESADTAEPEPEPVPDAAEPDDVADVPDEEPNQAEPIETSESETVEVAEVEPAELEPAKVETAQPEPTPVDPSELPEEEHPLVAFSSRARKLRDEGRKLGLETDAATQVPSVPDEKPAEPEVLFTSRKGIAPLTAQRDAPAEVGPTPLAAPIKAEAPAALVKSEPTPVKPTAPAAPAKPDPVSIKAPAPVASAKPDPSPAKAPPPPSPEPRTERAKKTAPAEPRRKRTSAPLGRQKVGGKPKYLGLILTVCLLIFLFVMALWANTLSEDGIAGWFKRPSDLVEVEPTSVPVVDEPVIETVTVTEPEETLPEVDPEPALPILRASGRILTPDEADRIYAATGVYQRAPRMPLLPRDTSIEDLTQARSIDFAQRPEQPIAVDYDLMAPDLGLESPRVPPPAGTSYQWDLRGFILATPEGVLTPNGAVVIAGAPERLPPARPGTPEPVPAEVGVSDVDPNAFRLIGGRPPLLPRERPEGLVPEQTAETEDAPTEDPLELAGAVADALIAQAEALETAEAAPEPAPVAEEQVAVAEETAPVTEEPVAVVEEPVALALAQPEPDTTDLVPSLSATPLVPSTLSPTQALSIETITEPVITPEAPAEQQPDLRLVLGAPEIEPPLRPVTEQASVTAPEAAPEGIDTPANEVAGLNVIAGRPDLLPVERPIVEQPAETSEVTPENIDVEEGLNVIAGRPSILPVERPVVEQPAETAVVTPEAAATEEGLNVIAGRPDVLPPVRPASAAPEVVVETPNAPNISGEEGVVLIAGRPDIVPPTRPVTAAPETSSESDAAAPSLNVVTGSPTVEPPLRPAGFSTRTAPRIAAADPALAGFRPERRPDDLVAEAVAASVATEPEPAAAPAASDIAALIAAAAPQTSFANVTAQAVARSTRPDSRPRNFSQVVARAQAASARRQQPAAAPSNTVSAQPARPSGPVPGGVARAATIDNAIRLRDVNLIGVYGRPNDRRALVRLSNGRYIKVEVGSRLDGGRVTAISESRLSYSKGGRTLTLQLPG